MKNIIIYCSIHNGNTKKVAKEMGLVLDAKVFDLSEAGIEDIEKADMVGFGSGIYFANFHKALKAFIESLPEMNDKNAFIFSTSGMKANNVLNRSHDKFKKVLKKKGFNIIGDFNCLGHDNYSVLKLFGGVHKGRPNQKDLERAKNFVLDIKEGKNLE